MARRIKVSKTKAFNPSVEVVERKGLGHPDTICDSVMDRISVVLSQVYLESFGFVAHHNTDKGLLVAGQSDVKFGGGSVTHPMKLVIGDRASFVVDGKQVPVDDIVVDAANSWFKENLRFVNEGGVVFQNELRPTSPQLSSIFKRSRKKGLLGANDTSAAVGYAPFSKTENLVLQLEEYLNSKDFKERFPETGEDVKVMALRRKEKLDVTVAMSFVDRFFKNDKEYFKSKGEVMDDVLGMFDVNSLHLNSLDKKGKGVEGCYLTVTGLSAENSDSGEVGRGNRVNGVIPLLRPAGSEAAAGKNPVSHIGKIYNVLTTELATDIYEEVNGLTDVYVWMVTRIGSPVDKPMVYVQASPEKGTTLREVNPQIKEKVNQSLDNIQGLMDRLARGECRIC